MKFIIHFAATAVARVRLAAFTRRVKKASQHYDPIADASRGPLLSMLISAC